MTHQTVPLYPEGRALLAGRSVLVTAAAGTGIGFATAKRCLEEDAFVVISDKHERRLFETAGRLMEVTGRRPPAIVCDVTSTSDVNAMIAFAEQETGGLDVLVNNAGLGGMSSVVDMTDEAWDQVIDVSLNGTMRCMRAALPGMYERKRGGIVNNASVLGWRAQAQQSHYAAAKAGVMALTRCAAIEAAQHGVRVNAVAPSLAMHAFLSKSAPESLLRQLESEEAFGRAAEPWEVANVIVFLASELSSYMTGEVLSVSSQRA
jgi:3-oxoacyl-[acyl-carrier protein] reductase